KTSPRGLIHRTFARRCCGQRALDGAPGILELTACPLQDSKPGLPVVAELIRTLERRGRALKVAHPQPDLPDLVVGESQALTHAKPLELLAGLTRFLLGLWPLAAEHLQLRSVNSADARISAQCLTPHPALALVAPLARALQIADVPTGGDRVAQDVARDPEVELARRRRCRRLIEKRQPFRNVALVQLAIALEARRHELD